MDVEIFYAADVAYNTVTDVVGPLYDRLTGVKIHAMYDHLAVRAIRDLKGDCGVRRVWMDAKLHETPQKALLRAEAMRKNGVDVVSVHASGGIRMMEEVLKSDLEVFAVTVLSSMSEAECQAIYGRSVGGQTLLLARWAKQAGVHGIICSPLEVAMLAQTGEFTGMKLVTPGIRSHTRATDRNHERFSTARDAVRNGSNVLVIGEMFNHAVSPVRTYHDIRQEIEVGLAER